MSKEAAESSAPRLPLIAIGVLIALAVTIAIAMGLRGAAEFEQGTPEAALQDYLDATLEGDDDRVLELLPGFAQERCAEELEDRYRSRSGVSFRLESMEVDGSRASAVVNERYASSGDPFGGSGSAGTETFELLQKANGEWLITEASWPWSIRNCLREES